jgi:integrase
MARTGRPKGTAKRLPKLRHHKASGQAVVTIGGRDLYCGKYGTREAEQAYFRVLSERDAAGGQMPLKANNAATTIAQIVAAYWPLMKVTHGPKSLSSYKSALRIISELYGDTPVGEFGPLKLRAVQMAMTKQPIPKAPQKLWTRTTVNNAVAILKAMFKWAVACELMPETKLHALCSLPNIRRGENGVREGKLVKPVDEAHVRAVLSFMSPQLKTMIQLQLLTGMRAGEVTTMRTCDVDRSGVQWIYRPQRHKSQDKGFTRTIFIGPKAQEILSPWFKPKLDAYLFTPADAERARLDARTAVAFGLPEAVRRRREKGRGYCRRYRSKRDLNRVKARVYPFQPYYNSVAYANAIANACNRADRAAHVANPEVPAAERIVPRWTSHQLRHSFGTTIRRHFGLDAAQVMLGHQHRQTTEIYAEPDVGQAPTIISQVG